MSIDTYMLKSQQHDVEIPAQPHPTASHPILGSIKYVRMWKWGRVYCIVPPPTPPHPEKTHKRKVGFRSAGKYFYHLYSNVYKYKRIPDCIQLYG